VAHAKEQDDSIFDFLYVDRQRLALFVAQLDDDGVIVQSKRIVGSSMSNQGELKGGIPSVATVGGTISDAATESAERQFDASYSLPLNALSILQSAGRIKKEAADLTLGHIVQLEGIVEIRDIDLIKRLWDTFTKNLVDKAPSHKKGTVKHEVSVAGNVLKELPPTTQIFVRTADAGYWGMLNGADPTFNSHFIGLKHGTRIQGTWQVIGILDALPDSEPASEETTGNLLSDMSSVINGMRTLLGRPFDSYGITPLAIFRPCGQP